MHEATKKSLEIIERLVATGDQAAYTVLNSEFPDEEGPDEAYAKRILAEYDQILNEIASVLSKKYGRPKFMHPPGEAPKWAQAHLRVTGWSVGRGIIYTFTERYDDWDLASCISVGYADQSSTEAKDDPWEYGREDV